MNPDDVRSFEPLHRMPRRNSLVNETASTLKNWISAGVLPGLLPGELQLKTRLGVGRDTVRLALKILVNEGWISPAAKGCARQIQPGRSTSDKDQRNSRLPVTFLSPHPVEHRVTLLEMADTESRLAEQGQGLRFISPRIFHLKNPGNQLERLLETHPSAAWILYISSEAIQRWFEKRGIPTFLYELPFPDVNLPFVASDWEGAAYHAGIQLLREGHRLIGLFEYRERRPGLLAMERGLKRALATVGSTGKLAVFKDDHSPISVAHALEAAFNLKEKPTAFVLSRAAQVLTSYSWLASRGVRVPGDVSVISIANDSWFDNLHPTICHYRPASGLMSRNIADRVMELVSTGRVARKSLQVQLEFIPGATIGSATPGPNRRRQISWRPSGPDRAAGTPAPREDFVTATHPVLFPNR
jgi:DNA-binding LacI/PurR family transcriptional regulator